MTQLEERNWNPQYLDSPYLYTLLLRQGKLSWSWRYGCQRLNTL